MNKNLQKPQSSLNISEEVVATIVSEAVKELDGVFSLANLPVKMGVLTTPSALKPIKITLNTDTAQIDVGIIMNMNYKIKDIAEQVQKTVKDTVQNMTSIAVSKVNVYVASVHVPQNN